mgnify:CR=1 FL=1
MTSVLLPEGELRVARCDMLDKLIAVGDGDAALLPDMFASGEVDRLYINFCDPWPKSNQKKRRLTHGGIHAQQPDRADGKKQSSNRQIRRSAALHRR